MKRIVFILFIASGFSMLLNFNTHAQDQQKEREVGVNIPYLGRSVVSINYGKDKAKLDEKYRLNYNKTCRPLEIKRDGKTQRKNFKCRWGQSDLNFFIRTRIGQGNERIFEGHFSSLEESSRIKKWSDIYKIKKGIWSYRKSKANGTLSGTIKFNLDEVAKVNPLDINDKNLEEEKRKIEEEKRKIEEEKKRIAEKEKENKEKRDDKLYIIGSGTGFFVSPRGHAVSNDHVVGICKKVAAKIKGEIKYFKILSTDQKNDLGLIKGNYVSQNYLSIKDSGAEFGEDIVAFGYPLSDALSSSVKLTRGIVSSLSGPGNNYSEIQIDAAIQPGNSGGPVMNMEGQVVGVASSGLNKLYMLEQAEYIPENVNFAVAAPTLTNFLKANGVMTKNRTYRIKNTKELAKVGRPATLQLFCMNTKSEFEKFKKQKKHSDVLLEKVVELK